MITIRSANRDDIETIIAFNMNMANETEGIDLNRDCIEQGVYALFDNPHKGRYFLAEIDGTVVGQTSVTLEWSDWRNGYWWWIQSVYIIKEARKKGVFRSIYEYIQTEAQQAGAVGLRLYVDESNHPAQNTYKNLGMEPSNYLFFEKNFK